MNWKKNQDLLTLASRAGLKTVSELALFLKLNRKSIA